MRTDRSFLESLIEQASEIETLIQARYRVYCLTTKPDSILMWSHYADRHRGICLEFDTANTVFSTALKVEYLDAYRPLDLSDNSAATTLLPLITKSAPWRYEDEYRLIAEEKSAASGHDALIAENGFLAFPRDALKSVIVGCAVSDAAREELRRIVDRSGHTLALKMARRIPNRYALTIGP